MTEEAAWLVQWFAARGKLADPSADHCLTANFFDAGWIDSFGVIELIGEAESHYGIRFEEVHFQDRRFPTVKGLAEMISEMKGNGK